ncbi:hypothetical protein M8J75_014338 [Diaphorina citri]|nr:hypothetical protein M8J75_014338 [Diaphorina citri]KAI5714778.1 hypothetical protein M8J77_005425 [Diaphorina citri]
MEEEDEEFTVQSEIFQPGRKNSVASCGLVISEFTFFNPQLEASNRNKKLLFDGDGDLILKRNNVSHSVVAIEHQARTTLDSVGLQVWRGALLLCDLMLDTIRIKPHSTILELGSGTGVSSIIASLHAKHVVCTDININGLLDQIRRNICLNQDIIRCPIAVHELDFYTKGLGSPELRDYYSKVNVVIAADVVYDDDLTDAFVSTLEYILSIPPRKTAYIALEKRYVFTLTDLNTVAPCYEHFVNKITSPSCGWVCELLPMSDIRQRLQYERLPQLVMWKIKASK